jgi:hypothetical protein
MEEAETAFRTLANKYTEDVKFVTQKKSTVAKRLKIKFAKLSSCYLFYGLNKL